MSECNHEIDILTRIEFVTKRVCWICKKTKMEIELEAKVSELEEICLDRLNSMKELQTRVERYVEFESKVAELEKENSEMKAFMGTIWYEDEGYTRSALDIFNKTKEAQDDK